LTLGATRHEIVAHFLRDALRAIGLACLCGLGLSIAAGRLLSGMLFGVSPLDPLTLTIVPALVMVVGSFAALVPSLRAARSEPAQVLREP
jgi:ABC-type antimicrobial peptide transport system permease subunit